jgi:hypothetical protein
MAFTSHTIQARSTSGRGPVKNNTYKGNGLTLYVRGQLLQKMADGTVDNITPGDDSFGIHAIYDGPTLTVATSDFVDIIDITDDTRFDVQGLDATAAQGNVGDVCDVESVPVGAGIWGANLDAKVEAGDLEVTQIYANTHDYDTGSDEAGLDGIIEVKVRSAKINTSPA